ncbi:MAG: hypothetical protein ACLVH7_16845 [Flavonifractor plautii]
MSWAAAAAPLWKDGQTLDCGGVVVGGLALGSEALVSKVVSIILFVVLLLAALLGALHMTPQQAVDKMRSTGTAGTMRTAGRPARRRFRVAAPAEDVLRTGEVAKEKPVRKRRYRYPADGEPSAMERSEKEFFARKSDAVRDAGSGAGGRIQRSLRPLCRRPHW